ncbi:MULTISPECIES: twin-arginine translocase subunit TatC [unclassified Candidatus Sulfotelmatobacter]|uniref:twin-arginine translocase subunit TatC n=1 Tax=unclassified Candidatus Sulfotelmatobacter TaxID=2635724 RepID=UPI0016829463|nr:twin-arginine translocase subunit TatC [Kocuria sp. cx-116]MBD2761515.1 twin-arginine translocase subunit TatC [Kocuria sp. cx-116]
MSATDSNSVRDPSRRSERRSRKKNNSRRSNPQAQMALKEHLREMRNRLIKSAIAAVIGAVAGFMVYNPFMQYITEPLQRLADSGRTATINYSSVGGSFNIMVEVALVLGVIFASPVWLYQLWAFITPALHKHERRYAMGFLATAIPLFIGGCALAVTALPAAVYALTAFTPEGGANFVEANQYLRFFLQLILTFGVACVIPVFLVGLNMLGLLAGRTILKSWRVVVVIVLVISAMAAPGPDPVTMLYLAIPLLALFFVAVGVCLFLDRRRARKAAKREADTGMVADSATSAQELRKMG